MSTRIVSRWLITKTKCWIIMSARLKGSRSIDLKITQQHNFWICCFCCCCCGLDLFWHWGIRLTDRWAIRTDHHYVPHHSEWKIGISRKKIRGINLIFLLQYGGYSGKIIYYKKNFLCMSEIFRLFFYEFHFFEIF